MSELKLRRRLLLSTAAAAIGLAVPLHAQADDFVVNMPVFTTNGGNVIDGNDVITVTGTGSITPPSGLLASMPMAITIRSSIME